MPAARVGGCTFSNILLRMLGSQRWNSLFWGVRRAWYTFNQQRIPYVLIVIINKDVMILTDHASTVAYVNYQEENRSRKLAVVSTDQVFQWLEMNLYKQDTGKGFRK